MRLAPANKPRSHAGSIVCGCLSAFAALALMASCGDARGAVVGVFSERDLIRAYASEGANVSSRFVSDLMTRAVVTCTPDTTMSEAERKMHEKRIRHLPVIEEGRVVGMLSIRDVVAWRLSLQRDEILVLRDAVIAARHS